MSRRARNSPTLELGQANIRLCSPAAFFMISVCRLTGLRGPVVVECVGVDDEYDANELGLVHLGALYRRECHRDPDSPETRDLKARLRAAIEAQQRSGGSVTRGAHTSCPADAFEPIPG